MNHVHTDRLELVPATLAHVEAEIHSVDRIGVMLDAGVPSSWPPGEYDRDAMEVFRSRLIDDPAAVGWYGWYAIHEDEDEGRVVVGAGGFHGPPDDDGIVEIGYSIAEEFRRRGFAKEMVEALVTHALGDPRVTSIVAHTTDANDASIAVLQSAGFETVAEGASVPALKFELRRSSSAE